MRTKFVLLLGGFLLIGIQPFAAQNPSPIVPVETATEASELAVPDNVIEETASEPLEAPDASETIDILDIRPEGLIGSPGERIVPDLLSSDSFVLPDVTKKKKKKPKKPEIRGEKMPPLEPILLFGAAEDLQEQARNEVEKAVKVEGTLLIEDHPVGRKSSFRRWVIETDDGKRFPLRSTLSLMTEVKKSGILDDRVSLIGNWLPSPGNGRLKFFRVDRIEPIAELGSPSNVLNASQAAAGLFQDQIASQATAGVFQDQIASRTKSGLMFDASYPNDDEASIVSASSTKHMKPKSKFSPQ